MNTAKNTLKNSEITTTPILLKYSASYGVDYFTENGINSIRGTNGSISITGSVKQSTLNYVGIRHLYYQNHITGSLMKKASMWNWNEQSTACSGSSDYENRYFPTESNSVIGIISISPQVYGEQISRKSFILTPQYSSNYRIVDDGNGNLVDTQNSNAHVGNVIYSQGMIVITNPDYSIAFSQTQLAIFVINSANGILLNSFSIESGTVTYTGGTFPVTSQKSTTVFPNSDQFSVISGQFNITANGSYCVRSRHVNKDANGNILNTYVDQTQLDAPNLPSWGSAPVTINVELNYAGTVDQYSYLEFSISNGSCT